jgi:hypothetical protein
MMPTATQNEHYNAHEPVLFMAFELREKTWRLGFTTGHGQKPREHTVTARQQARGLQEITQAKRRFGLPETALVVSCDEAGRKGFWWHRFFTGQRITTRWWIPPRLRAIVASVGPRVMGWTSASWCVC